MALKFGDKIEFDVRFKRIRERGRLTREDWRMWVLKPVPKATGILIGRRTLWNGMVDHCDRLGFEFCDSIPAYLVAVDMATNPVLIPIDRYNEEERIKYAKENY